MNVINFLERSPASIETTLQCMVTLQYCWRSVDSEDEANTRKQLKDTKCCCWTITSTRMLQFTYIQKQGGLYTHTLNIVKLCAHPKENTGDGFCLETQIDTRLVIELQCVCVHKHKSQGENKGGTTEYIESNIINSYCVRLFLM